jgi:hypothetical protein
VLGRQGAVVAAGHPRGARQRRDHAARRDLANGDARGARESRRRAGAVAAPATPPVPASVVTAPPGAILRIVWSARSAM